MAEAVGNGAELVEGPGDERPKEATEPRKIDESDLLRYQLKQKTLEHALLKRDMYMREMQRAAMEVEEVSRDLNEFRTKELPKKYEFDGSKFGITDDGYIAPQALMNRGR